MRAAVVVPTNRPERIGKFCQAWEEQFRREDVSLFVIEDAPSLTCDLVPKWAKHYCWEDIPPEGISAIPTRSGGIRNLGFVEAGVGLHTVDLIVSLDDDVTPTPGVDLLADHWRALEERRLERWQPTAPFPTRGLPYAVRTARTVVLNHGLWSGTPDLDAYHQLGEGAGKWQPALGDFPSQVIAPGSYYSMCIMNVAVRREHVRYLWMPTLPEGYKRWDDIWSGVVFKRLADLYGWSVTSGQPVVIHDRASNVLTNLRQEMLGYGLHERLWQVVDKVGRNGNPQSTWLDIWAAIQREFPQLSPVYQNAQRWAELWEAV